MESLKKGDYVIFNPSYYERISRIQPRADLTHVYQVVRSSNVSSTLAIISVQGNADTWHQGYFIRINDVSKLEKAIHGIKG